MKIQQLRIDIKTEGNNDVNQAMYDDICKVITEHDGVVMDDGHAPYTEDMTEDYKKIMG